MSDKAHTPESHDGVSRRSFLKGSGAAAAATAIATSAAEAVGQDAKKKPIATAALVKMNVNGKDHEVVVEPRTTLLEVLRYQLDLTGAKPVSGDGSCSRRRARKTHRASPGPRAAQGGSIA